MPLGAATASRLRQSTPPLQRSCRWGCGQQQVPPGTHATRQQSGGAADARPRTTPPAAAAPPLWRRTEPPWFLTYACISRALPQMQGIVPFVAVDCDREANRPLCGRFGVQVWGPRCKTGMHESRLHLSTGSACTWSHAPEPLSLCLLQHHRRLCAAVGLCVPSASPSQPHARPDAASLPTLRILPRPRASPPSSCSPLGRPHLWITRGLGRQSRWQMRQWVG